MARIAVFLALPVVVLTGCWRHAELALDAPDSGSDSDSDSDADSDSDTDTDSDTDGECGGDGNHLAWATSAVGNGNDEALAASALPDGEIAVVGNYHSGLTFAPGEPDELSISGGDMFLVRLDADGLPVWIVSVGSAEPGVGGVHAWDIDCFDDGACAVTGKLNGSMVFGEGGDNETALSTGGLSNADAIIAMYDIGGDLAWASAEAIGSGQAAGLGIATFSDGSLALAGVFAETAVFGAGGPNEIALEDSLPDNGEMFIAKYDGDGDLLWARSVTGWGLVWPRSVAGHADGSVTAVGQFEDIAIFGPGEPGETTIASNGIGDIFVARFDGDDGQLEWVDGVGSNPNDQAFAVAGAGDGDAVVTGAFRNNVVFGEGGAGEVEVASTTPATTDIFLVRYDAQGEPLWATSAGGGQDDYGGGVALLPDGTIALAGKISGSATFGLGDECTTTITVGMTYMYGYSAFYEGDGSLRWVEHHGGEVEEWGSSVAGLSDGSFAVVGRFEGDALFGQDEPNETLLDGTNLDDAFIARFVP
jgi:hypothetical protein